MAKRNTHEQQIRQARFKRPVGRVEPFDTFENTRDHERIWFELERRRNECCDDKAPPGTVEITDLDKFKEVYRPLAWYRFLPGKDDPAAGAAGQLFDSSGNGYHGAYTLSGSGQQGQLKNLDDTRLGQMLKMEELRDGAVAFWNGQEGSLMDSTDRIGGPQKSEPKFAFKGTTSFSVVLWLEIGTTASSLGGDPPVFIANEQGIVGTRGTNPYERGWGFWVQGGFPAPHESREVFFSRAVPRSEDDIPYPASVLRGWTYGFPWSGLLCATYDGRRTRLYINGRYVSGVDDTEDIDPLRSTLQIGQIDFGTALLKQVGYFGSKTFDDLVGEVVLFDRCLTSAEIRSIFLLGTEGRAVVPDAGYAQVTLGDGSLNGALRFVAKQPGPEGASILIGWKGGGGLNLPLNIRVGDSGNPFTDNAAGRTIIVEPETNASEAAISTATQIKAAIDADPDASKLVTVELVGDGSGVFQAFLKYGSGLGSSNMYPLVLDESVEPRADDEAGAAAASIIPGNSGQLLATVAGQSAWSGAGADADEVYTWDGAGVLPKKVKDANVDAAAAIGPSKLAAGAADTILKSSAGVPIWEKLKDANVEPAAGIKVSKLETPTLIGAILSSAIPYAVEVAADNPTVWWKLNEASGAVAADSASGGAAPGTYESTPGYGVAGPVVGDTAIELNTSSDKIRRLSPINVTGQWTLECWVYRSVAAGGSGATIIKNGASSNGYGILWAADSFIRGKYGATFGAISSVAVPINTWTHLALARAADGVARLYIDGVEVAADVVTPAAPTAQYEVGNGAPIVWRVAHAALYPAALSATRLLAHKNAGPAVSDVGWGKVTDAHVSLARTRAVAFVPIAQTQDDVPAWPDGSSSFTRYLCVVPPDYKSGDLTVKLYRRGAAAGTAVMRRDAYRLRAAAALTALETATNIDFTPGDVNTTLTTWTITAANFQAGDVIRIDIERLGADAGDTMTAPVEADGLWAEYTATV